MMIHFIEHDSEGNISHVCADPLATIVPLVNRVEFKDTLGKPCIDVEGNALSHCGLPLADPVRITETEFSMLMAEGSDHFIFNPLSSTLTRKVPSGL